MYRKCRYLLFALVMVSSISIRAQTESSSRKIEVKPDELVTPSATDANIVTFDFPHAVHFPESESSAQPASTLHPWDPAARQEGRSRKAISDTILQERRDVWVPCSLLDVPK